MAEIAIPGGEPYGEWIKRDGNAQRLFKAYRNRWPEGDTRCATIGDEFYVRFSDGDKMRRVYNVGDFDNEGAQCGTPIDTDNGDYYSCDVWDCEAVLCDDCGRNLTCDGHYCPQHRGSETLMGGKARLLPPIPCAQWREPLERIRVHGPSWRYRRARGREHYPQPHRTASRPRNRWNVPRCVCSSVRDARTVRTLRAYPQAYRGHALQRLKKFSGVAPPLWKEETCVLL